MSDEKILELAKAALIAAAINLSVTGKPICPKTPFPTYGCELGTNCPICEFHKAVSEFIVAQKAVAK